jgi:uncharacterized protein YqeY
MALIDEINAKLKNAMLSRDQFLVGVLRDLKSAFVYEEVAKGKKDVGLDEAELEAVIAREAKKRTDAAEIYRSAGDVLKAEKEIAEREILANFLPEQLSEDELKKIIKQVIDSENFGPKDIGRVIGGVKSKVGSQADGAIIAKLTKELLK